MTAAATRPVAIKIDQDTRDRVKLLLKRVTELRIG